MTKYLRAAYGVALLAIVCLLTNAPAHAQSVYGSVFGTVTDSTGAVVPGATVTVTDEAKGTVETATTNEAGDYNVGHLVPDTYDVKVDAKGFKSFVSKGVTVLADTAPRVDVALTVASGAGETVTVDADSVPQLKTDRADVSTVFDSQQVNDLPIAGQNFTNLQLLLPGAQQLGWSHAASENPQASKQIQIDGQAFGGVAYELDGTDNQDPILGIIVVNPSLDSVTEAKISTQNFDAELGKAVAAVVTVQTKSGSNSFHGSAYDFRTDNAQLARDPFSQCSGSYSLTHTCAIPPGVLSKFGGSIGGPIWKDRAFFFGAYEGQRQKVGTSNVNTLPSLKLTESCLSNQGCDFSEYLTNLPGAGTAFPQGRIYDLSQPFVGGVPQAFPGNVIPDTQVSKQWKNFLTVLEPYVKTESTDGALGGLASNSKIGGTGIFNSDLWATRFDVTLSPKQSAFVRFSRWTDTLTGKQMYGPAGGPGFGIGGFGGFSQSADDSLALGTDYVFSPKLITDLRIGYLRYNIIDTKSDQTLAAADSLGINGLNVGGATGGLPSFFLNSLPSGAQPQYGDGLGISRCNCPLTEREDQFQIVNNWTKTFGNHSLKVGADLRYGRNLRVPSDANRTGVMNFSQGPTSFSAVPKSTDPNITNYQGGLSFATLALGDVTSFNRYVSTSTNAKEFQKRVFFYGQDTWRASSKLTLNLGVRWEGYFPESVNGKGNGALLDLKTGYIRVAGYGNNGSNMGWGVQFQKQFEPRLGVAYQLDPKTVIRGGYGRSFDIGVFGSIFGHVVTQNLPVLANQSISANGTGQAFCIGSQTDNPGCNVNNNSVPEGVNGGPAPNVFPTVPNSGLLPNPGYAVNTKSRPNPLNFPTLDAWNLSVQRSLTSSLSLTAAYVGNKGTHTLGDGDSNNTNPNESAISLPASYTINGQTLHSVNGQALHFDPSVNQDITKGPVIAADGGTAITKYLQRYYGGGLAACSDPTYAQPTDGNFTGGALPTGACGWSQGVSNYGDNQNTNFNALQITLSQATWKGLSATANYQLAAANGTGSGFFTWSPKSVYGPDSNVRTHAATLYGSYMFPFGKGKQYFNSANKVEDLIVGGWEFSSTMNLSSGLPFTINANGCPNIPGSAPCYANQTSRLKTSLSSFVPGKGWTFYNDQTGNTNFSQPGLDAIGNSGRNSYRGPNFFNTDMSLQKSFNLWEKVSAKFRVDAYNAVNHINPGTPGGNIIGTQYITGEAPGPGPRQIEFSARIQF